VRGVIHIPLKPAGIDNTPWLAVLGHKVRCSRPDKLERRLGVQVHDHTLPIVYS
jgi:hypothetical protein